MKQSSAILAHLQKGKSITPLQALDLYQCLRLGARIWDLRQDGYAIEREMVHDPKTGKIYASYMMAE